MRAQSVAADTPRTQPGTGLLYGWLLAALFVEYARPANQLTFLQFPYFYSLVPMTLMLVQSFARGLKPIKEIFSDRIAKWVLVLLGAVAASWAASGFNHYGSLPFQATLGYVFLFVLIARIVTTEARLRGVIVILTLAHFYLLAFNSNILTDPTQRQYIVGGSFLGDGNDFSLSMCILIPLMVEIALSTRNRFYQVLAWSATALIIMAIIATQSRGGTLGITAVLAYLWWRSPRKLVSAVAIALVGGLILLYAPSQYFQRMGTVTGGTIDGSAQGRLDAWSGAIGMGAKNPVFGIGTGQFGARWGKTAHSTYMLAFAELGILGFICSIVLVFGNIRANLKLRQSIIARLGPATSRDSTQTLRLLDMTNAAMVGFAVAGAFLSAIYYPHIFVLTALMLAARQFPNVSSSAGNSARIVPSPKSKIPERMARFYS
ncbi:MAG: O-antigen ligase family protein [Steroidobacteraceae bacterium]